MRLPIRFALSLNHLAVVLIGMALAGLLAWLAVERLYLDTQSANLLAQARLTAAALQGTTLPENPAEPYVQAANVAPGIHTRLLGDSGAVLVGLPLLAGGEPVQVPSVENIASISPAELIRRTEIQQALQGQAATAVRRVPSAGNQRVLYAAAPVSDADGRVAGLVYLATPLPAAGLPAGILPQLIGAILAAMLLSGLAGTFLARRMARPLESLAEAAKAVSEGDLGQRLPTESSLVELHSLGEAFNNMVASLQRSDRLNKTFIADVTHELRTPLTVIKGTLETLEDGALEDLEGRGALLASMQSETERLIRLVNDLLVLARADAGSLQLEIRTLDLEKLAGARCEHMRLLADHRQIELRVAAPCSDPTRRGINVRGDADRLAQVLDNLLDNAIRHSPERSTVTVSLQSVEDGVECTVRDQGDGIPAGHLPFIFERFYRIDSSRDRHSGGAGLGLAIARALILAQGGQIEVHSLEGEGTAIRFRLPAGGDCHPTA